MATPAAAGAIAGLAAGLLLSAAWLGIEAATGEPTELVRLERRSLALAGRRDSRREMAMPDSAEQVASHGGHLALSAAAGGLYGLAAPPGVSPLAAGAAFGAVFYALAYGLLAPALGLRPAPWRDAPASVGQRGFFHLLFGLLVAGLTPAIDGWLRRD